MSFGVAQAMRQWMPSFQALFCRTAIFQAIKRIICTPFCLRKAVACQAHKTILRFVLGQTWDAGGLRSYRIQILYARSKLPG